MRFKKLLSAVAATAIAASAFAGMAVTASAADVTVKYALAEGDTFTSGQTVNVMNGDDKVATITYGESGGAEFKAAAKNNSVEGFDAFTEGNGTNGNKTGGTFYTIVPVYDGTIDVAVVLNKDKEFYIEEDKTALSNYNGITVSEKYYGTYSFNVTANKSYKVYCSGSKLGFYGFKYTYTPAGSGEGGGEETPTTYSITDKTATDANGRLTISKKNGLSADEDVTITVVPDTGYELATLTVNGVDVTTEVSSNEYIFSMPADDIDVSATFTATSSVEPGVEPTQAVMPLGATAVATEEFTALSSGVTKVTGTNNYVLATESVLSDGSNFSTGGNGTGNNYYRRNISIIPAAAGKLTVVFRTSNTDRQLYIKQGDVTTTKAATEKNTDTFAEVDVTAEVPVYLYSTNSIDIYSITLSEIVTEPTTSLISAEIVSDFGVGGNFTVDDKNASVWSGTISATEKSTVYAKAVLLDGKTEKTSDTMDISTYTAEDILIYIVVDRLSADLESVTLVVE